MKTTTNGHSTHARPLVRSMMRAAVYARVSTSDQDPENQLGPLRSYVVARGWHASEFTDHGISGAKDRRPALDAMLAAELEALGVELVVLDQAIDTTTPAGRLLFHVLAAIAEFERTLVVDRVLAGIRRARAQGKHLGRPRRHRVDVDRARELLAGGHSLRATARALGVPHVAVSRALAAV